MAQEISIGGQALSDLENLLNDVVSSLAKYEGVKGGEAIEFKGKFLQGTIMRCNSSTLLILSN